MSCEIMEKERAGVINPIFTCQPCGAQYASIGIKDCIAIVHGGQGCVMFVRLLFSQHFKDNFEIASSSVHEDGAVFGATNRVEEAVDVLLMRYPEVKVVPIISTCSTEVIGDDIDGVVTKLNSGLLKEKYPGREVHLIAIHTPSFVGSMISGYDVAVRDIITHFAEKGEANGKLNLITGWVNPGDVKELKHLLKLMDVDANVLFEIESFDSPLLPNGTGKSHGSTTIDDLKDTANALGTIALNRYEGGKAAEYLHKEFDIPTVIGPSPIGIRNTDIFLKQVSQLTGKPLTRELVHERGIALIVDESFIDFIAGATGLVAMLADHPRLYLLRSLTKFYAIPGLRLGYLLSADTATLDAMRCDREPWTINAFAALAGEVVMADDPYRVATYQWLAREQAYLFDALSRLPGIKVWQPAANYLFLRSCSAALELQQALLCHNVLIRHCANYPGLDQHYYRVAIRSHEENRTLVAAMTAVLETAALWEPRHG